MTDFKKLGLGAFFGMSFLLSVSCGGGKESDAGAPLDVAFIDENLDAAVRQYKVLMERLPEDMLPKTYLADKDSMVNSGSRSWTSGFYPGTLLYLYEFSGDEALLSEATQKLDILERKKNNKGTHDLGFMLYCSFGNAWRLTGDERYKEIMLTGAESLISRYNDTVGCIRSWDHNSDKWEFPVIVDNMMNIEALMRYKSWFL